MTTNTDDKAYSDDEVFFGKLTLKEVKKRVMMDYHRPSLSYTKTKIKCSDSSAEIIETCSEPELKPISLDDSSLSLCSSSEDKITNTCDLTSDEQSFLEKEKMVSELLLVDKKEKEDLDNTLDVMEDILNNAPSTECCLMVNCDIEKTSKDHSANNLQDTEINSKRSQSPIEILEIANVKCYINTDCTSPIIEENLSNNLKSALAVNRSSSKTTSKTQNNIYLSSINIEQTSVFKTPKAAGLKKHVQTPKNTPKQNLYEHIASPVAAYIKNGQQVPLLKNVRPNKPLSGMSSIPKPIGFRKKK